MAKQAKNTATSEENTAETMETTQETLDFKSEFISYVLEHDKRPTSAYQLAKALNVPESAFYDEYNSIEMLEKEIWGSFFDETSNILQADSEYQAYTVREKMLSFYFTWIQVLKDNRSYVLFCDKNRRKGDLKPYFLEIIKEKTTELMKEFGSEGIATNEISARPFLSDRYGDLLWAQSMLVLRFWVKDDSKNFQNTDAMIEKTVNTSFALMGETFLDSLFDFGKFAVQNIKK